MRKLSTEEIKRIKDGEEIENLRLKNLFISQKIEEEISNEFKFNNLELNLNFIKFFFYF